VNRRAAGGWALRPGAVPTGAAEATGGVAGAAGVNIGLAGGWALEFGAAPSGAAAATGADAGAAGVNICVAGGWALSPGAVPSGAAAATGAVAGAAGVNICVAGGCALGFGAVPTGAIAATGADEVTGTCVFSTSRCMIGAGRLFFGGVAVIKLNNRAAILTGGPGVPGDEGVEVGLTE